MKYMFVPDGTKYYDIDIMVNNSYLLTGLLIQLKCWPGLEMTNAMRFMNDTFLYEKIEPTSMLR